MPIFAAAVMTQKHKGLMRSSNSSNADYLFQECERSHACLKGGKGCVYVCVCVCVCQLVLSTYLPVAVHQQRSYAGK